MPRNFTREAFYGLVWSKPMTHLAKEFALSDVALHKICRKHGIPTPPLGWWAKKAAGKAVTQTPLPESPGGPLDNVTIAGANLTRETSAIADVRERARVLASDGVDSEGIADPIVDRTIAWLRKAKPSEIGVVKAEASSMIRCDVAPSSIDRLAVILPRIAAAARQQGFRLAAGEKAAVLVSAAESLDFAISETIRRDKHVLTDAERAKEEAWQKKRDRAVQRRSWDAVFSDRPRFPEWDHHASGLLSLELEHVYVSTGAAPRRSFRDAKTQRLENMASEIAIGLAVLAAAKTGERLRREEAERKREEVRRRREMAERAKHIEERRAAGLASILSEVEELDRASRLLARLEAEASDEPTLRLAEFLRWAREHVATRADRLSARSLEIRFDVDNLFGDEDDRGFSPSHWY